MGEFRDTASKMVIRKKWCKSLLQFINEKLKYKLIYLGLPGPQALDLLEWIEYIDQVIAFQCRDYPNPSSIEQDRRRVLELEEKLRTFEREGKLTTYSLYDGYIEEVLLRGRDTNGNKFSQNDMVTVYNLDFCNGITVPLEVKDDEGNVKKYYKSEAIRRLLEIQRDITSRVRAKKFIMFLTIHSLFWKDEAEDFMDHTESEPIKQYVSEISSLRGSPKWIRLLKTYVFDTVRSYFCNYDFTPEFLPAIYYEGAGKNKKNWLVLFTIIGAENKKVRGAPCFQKPEDFFKQNFLSVDNQEIYHWSDKKNNEINGQLDSVNAFSNAECVKRLWK